MPVTNIIRSYQINLPKDYKTQLTIILRVRVGYEMVDSQRGALRRVGY